MEVKGGVHVSFANFTCTCVHMGLLLCCNSSHVSCAIFHLVRSVFREIIDPFRRIRICSCGYARCA